MPLPGAVLFPYALLPLYIFEPRYRKMLEQALQLHRMFCVALIKPSCPVWHAPEDFFHSSEEWPDRGDIQKDRPTEYLQRSGTHVRGVRRSF